MSSSMFVQLNNLGKQRLFPVKFSEELKSWEAYSDQKIKDSVKKPIEKLTIATWNISANAETMDARWRKIMKTLEDQKEVDIFVLQDVLPGFEHMLSEEEFIQKSFYMSDWTGHHCKPQGITILSRFPILQCYFHFLPTNYQRKLMTAKILVGPSFETDTVLIGNIHLESGKWENETRARQMEMITKILFPMLNETQGLFLAGDFASDPTWRKEAQNWDNSLFVDTFNNNNNEKNENNNNENINIINNEQEELKDGFKTVGATHLTRWDGNKPKNYQQNETLPEFYCRFDRICFYSQSWKYSKNSNTNFGSTNWQNDLNSIPAADDSNVIFPSDHLGVKASFERQL